MDFELRIANLGRPRAVSLSVISYPLFGRSVDISCPDDFNDFNDFNDFYDFYELTNSLIH